MWASTRPKPFATRVNPAENFNRYMIFVNALRPGGAMADSIDDALASLQRASRQRESGQHGLFAGGGLTETTAPFLLQDAPQWSEEERLASEYAMLGFYVSGHPLEKYSSRLAEWNVVRLEEVEGQRNGKEIAKRE